MRINKSLLAALAASLALGSCTDFTNGFDEKRHEFAENFANEFGAINPDQDWNMAARYSASINLGNDVNGELKLYSDAPGVKGSQYLGHVEVVNGVATLDFDAVKGSKYFYAAVKNTKGRVVSLGYYIPNGNKVEIADEHLATRATSSPVSKGNKVDLRVERIKEGAIADFLTYYGDGSNKKKNYFKMCQDLTINKDGYDVPKWDINGQGGAENHLMYKLASEEGTLIPNLYRLNNVDFTHHDAGYTSKFLRTIFGDFTDVNGETGEGIYKESIDHIALMHNAVKDVEPDVLYTVAEGGGEVELDCIWRGTAGSYDFFGYYYYDGDEHPNGLTAEELWNTEKYILIDEYGAGSSNICIGGSTQNTLTEGKSAQWKWNATTYANDILYYDDSWSPLHGEECKVYMNNQLENLIRGTKIKLTYFGGATPSYHFPENTKIGFFLGWNKVTGSTQAVAPNANRIFFSDCAKTYQLFRRGYKADDSFKSAMTPGDLLPASFTSTHEVNNGGMYEGPDVRPFANTFKFRDLVIMGFGDEVAGDKDLNDICFIVNGHIDEPEDITPENVPEPEPVSWLMACEDLGNTDDFDFNDVVFKVSHVANETKAKITALASGGTLPVELTYNGDVLTGPNNSKTHFNSWFDDGRIEDGQAINAGAGTVQATGKSIEIPVPVDFSLANASVSNGRMGGFALKVYDREEGTYTEIAAPNDGDAPQMMCLPSNWVWPNERTRITEAYPLFGEWGSNYNVTNWYMHYDASNLVTTPDYASIPADQVTTGGGEGSGEGTGSGSDSGEVTPPSDSSTYDITSRATAESSYSQNGGNGYSFDVSDIDFTGATKVTLYVETEHAGDKITLYQEATWGVLLSTTQNLTAPFTTGDIYQWGLEYHKKFSIVGINNEITFKKVILTLTK